MNSTGIYPGVAAGGFQSGGATNSDRNTSTEAARKSFVGFLNSLSMAAGGASISTGEPILSKKQALAQLQIKGTDISDVTKVDEMVKSATSKMIAGMMPGATAGQINEMKVKFSANINNLEKAMKSVLQQHGIPSPDIQVMPPEMIMVNLPDGLMEDLSNVLGAFVSGFDSSSGTSFAKNLKISIQNLTSEDGQDLNINFDGFAPKNEVEFVEAAIATVATMMGVERPAKNSAPTATQTLMLSQYNPITKGANKAGNLDSVATQSTPKATPEVTISGPVRTSMDTASLPVGWAPDETMEEGLKSFVRSTLFSAETTAKMGGDIAKAASFAGQVSTSSNTAPTAAITTSSLDPVLLKPGMPDFARLETFEAVNQLSADSVSAEDFEEILNTATKSKTTSDALTQAQANRFANLINSQIKTAELGDRKTRIELAPKGLGEIEINIENDASGKMRAVIRVENPAVLELMKADKSQLMDLLSQKGIDLSDGSLDLEGFDKEGQDEGGSDGQGAMNGEEGAEVLEDEAGSIIPSQGPSITDTTVDIQI